MRPAAGNVAAADATPTAVAITSGWVTIRLTASTAVVPMLFCCGFASAIKNGTKENKSSVSKQKINATGTAASGPSVANARPGPM